MKAKAVYLKKSSASGQSSVYRVDWNLSQQMIVRPVNDCTVEAMIHIWPVIHTRTSPSTVLYHPLLQYSSCILTVFMKQHVHNCTVGLRKYCWREERDGVSP